MRSLSGALAVLLACAALTSHAQEYPHKPLRMIVPAPAGGALDVVARLIGPKLSEVIGQPIVLENRVAAGGVVGANQVAQSPADGYTLLAVFDSFATNAYLYKGVQHDPVKDFAPITLITKSPQVLAVHPDVAARSYPEFIELVKSKGTAFNFATAGAGTSSRFSLELFKGATGVEPTAVHYKGGAPALNDLLGGQVQAMIATVSLVLPHIQRGKLVALAVSAPARIAQLPDTPPLAQWLTGFEAQSWVGLVAPINTPRPIIERINTATRTVLGQADVRERLAAQGSEIVGSSPEMFGEWLKAETTKWSKVIRERNITLD